MTELPAASFVCTDIAKLPAVLTVLVADEPALAAVERAARLVANPVGHGNKALFVGNDHSAADEERPATELVGRLSQARPGLPPLLATTDSSILKAGDHDCGFESVFARRVEALGARGDVLVAISISGRSWNILRALEATRGEGFSAIGITGSGSREMAVLCDRCLRAPAAEAQHIQEARIVRDHIPFAECLLSSAVP